MAKINRREFVHGVGAVAAVNSMAAPQRRLSALFLTALRTTAAAGPVVLKDTAAAKGILYGCSATKKHLMGDKSFADVVEQECALIVPEAELKWNFSRPSPNTFNFELGDWLLHWATEHKLLLRGTALVWHEALPSWFEAYVNRGNAKRLMVDHIQGVLQHYAGKFHSWDVVNEGLTDAGLRKTPWLRLIGPDYIEIAFRAAAEADPDTILTYNEYDLCFQNDDSKRAETLNLLKKLVSRKVPIHALGIQGHLRRDRGGFNPSKMTRFLSQVADLGLKILITELDIRDSDADSEIERRDRSAADAYREYLETVLKEKAVKLVVTWGLTDRYTWLQKKAPRADGKPVRPLPLDIDLNPKPAFFALADAFQHAPPRQP